MNQIRLPDRFPNLTTLNCSMCPMLVSLPPIPDYELKIERNHNIIYLEQYKDLPEDKDSSCIVCLDNKACVIFNCGHMKTCISCSIKMVELGKCPYCQTVINTVIKVFM